MRKGLTQLGAYIAIVIVAAFGFHQHQVEIKHNRDAVQRLAKVNVALCADRVDLDHRIAAGKAFLKKHPHGIRDIPASVIRQSLSTSERTRKVLEVLDCPAAEGTP